MLFTPENYHGYPPIQAYQVDSIKINDISYTHSLIISAEQIITDWPVKHINELNLSTLQALINIQPEIILIGTGTKALFPAATLLQAVLQQGIGIEMMDTGAACRTYNLLLAEGRKVAVGIIIP